MRSRLDPNDVDDAVAATFATAWKRREDSPNGPEHYRAWLYGIARREVLNHRRASRRRRLLDDQMLRNAALGEHRHVDVIGPDVEISTEVAAAIADLSRVDRDLLIVVALRGFSLREAADEIGVTHGAARMRMVRLRAQTQTFLREWR